MAVSTLASSESANRLGMATMMACHNNNEMMSVLHL
jgi:hypothetical protein